jgi:hypothetical protein
MSSTTIAFATTGPPPHLQLQLLHESRPGPGNRRLRPHRIRSERLANHFVDRGGQSELPYGPDGHRRRQKPQNLSVRMSTESRLLQRKICGDRQLDHERSRAASLREGHGRVAHHGQGETNEISKRDNLTRGCSRIGAT